MKKSLLTITLAFSTLINAAESKVDKHISEQEIKLEEMKEKLKKESGIDLDEMMRNTIRFKAKVKQVFKYQDGDYIHISYLVKHNKQNVIVSANPMFSGKPPLHKVGDTIKILIQKMNMNGTKMIHILCDDDDPRIIKKNTTVNITPILDDEIDYDEPPPPPPPPSIPPPE